MSGFRVTAGAPSPPGMPGHCPPTRRASRAPSLSMTQVRALAGCWRLILISPALVAMFMMLLSMTIVNVALSARPRSALRLRLWPGSWPGAAVRSSPTSRPPAAATSSWCSRPRCRGSSCATSPGQWRCASPRSTRPRCLRWAARSALPARATNPGAGGCSRCPWRTPRRWSRTRTGRRCGPRCWPSSRPSCAGSNVILPVPRRRMRPSWTTRASRGCPASAAVPRSALSSSTLPAPDGGTDRAIRAAARRVWPSWARPRPGVGA